jgi:hypothetical protein
MSINGMFAYMKFFRNFFAGKSFVYPLKYFFFPFRKIILRCRAAKAEDLLKMSVPAVQFVYGKDFNVLIAETGNVCECLGNSVEIVCPARFPEYFLA